ncbi:hypothetical protein [Leucobacter ruminantium]|uniref:Uncharacterized protein n=1 Tax=Leucobacter ruminantium TaxID=1289170 RepID=A0A939LS72_9MICO|nr:hypothetical protein [Leucobacter ruminantium]MBO1803819.1 hypothetical protein [Leucobacter ruminantium]
MEGSRPAVRPRRAHRASRGARTLRGTLGAAAATLIAAASHSLAGGSLTWQALAATAILSLPVCVLLAGRAASLWRLSLAVCTSQFLFHWSFAGLGAPTATGSPAPLHAAHLAALERFAPTPLASGAAEADAAMWLGHAVAALLTIALLHRGERAGLALLRLIRRALPCAAPRLSPVSRRPAPTAVIRPIALRDRLFSSSAITHRGPPLAV